MADIVGSLKKRMKKGKKDNGEQPIDRLTFEGLVALRAKLAADPSTDFSGEFSKIIKEFFHKLLKLRYQPTYEELISEIAGRRFTDEMKKEMVDYLQEMIHLEFSPGGMSRPKLVEKIGEFENLVIKATSDSARPHRAQNLTSAHSDSLLGRIFHPKKEPSTDSKHIMEEISEQAHVSPLSEHDIPTAQDIAQPKEQEEQKPTKKRFNLFGKKIPVPEQEPMLPLLSAPPEIQLPQPTIQQASEMPPPSSEPETHEIPKRSKKKATPKPADKLAEIYDLFKSAYDYVKNNEPEKAEAALVKIREINIEFDKKTQSDFRDEISHLSQEIDQLKKDNPATLRILPPPPIIQELTSSKKQGQKPEVLEKKLSGSPRQKPGKKESLIEKTDAFTLFHARKSEDEPEQLAGPDTEEKSEVEILKHAIKKKDFSAEPEEIAKGIAGGGDTEPPELPKLSASIISTLEKKPKAAKPVKPAKKTEIPLPSQPKAIPEPPNIPELLETSTTQAPEKEAEAYPLKFNFIPPSDKPQEVIHEPPRFEDILLEEDREFGPVVDNIYEGIKAQNKYRDEEIWSEESLVSRIINKRFISKKTGQPPGIQPLGLPPPDYGKLQSTDKELLTRISGLITQMEHALSSRNIDEADRCWEEISEIRLAISPILSQRMDPIVEKIASTLSMLKSTPSGEYNSSSDPGSAGAGNDGMDHNQMILSAALNLNSQTAGQALPESATGLEEPPLSSPPYANQQLPLKEPENPTPKQEELMPKKQKPAIGIPAQALDDLNKELKSARDSLKDSRVDEANQAYQRALLLKKKIKVDEAEKSRLSYELMDLNVAIRMAKIK